MYYHRLVTAWLVRLNILELISFPDFIVFSLHNICNLTCYNSNLRNCGRSDCNCSACYYYNFNATHYCCIKVRRFQNVSLIQPISQNWQKIHFENFLSLNYVHMLLYKSTYVFTLLPHFIYWRSGNVLMPIYPNQYPLPNQGVVIYPPQIIPAMNLPNLPHTPLIPTTPMSHRPRATPKMGAVGTPITMSNMKN